MTVSRKISISLLSVSIFLTGCATSPEPFRSQTMITSELPQPIWNSHLILWPDDSEEYAVWRTDPRFEGRFAANYPDDVQVLFINHEGVESGKNEIMWVTIIQHDPATDLFLGILTNEPFHLHDIAEGDNVVLRFDPDFDYPLAVSDGSNYRIAGLPDTNAPEFLATLMAGVREYRKFKYRQDSEAIQKSLGILTPALKEIPEAVNSEELFAAHFIVARCLAECYETKSAIEHFKSAIAIDPEDVHAHLGLMAELSVMVHWPANQPEPEDQLVWDKALLDQMIVIKTRFKHNLSAQAGIRIIMDESRAGDLSDLNEDQLARRRKFGFGILRWKMR